MNLDEIIKEMSLWCAINVMRRVPYVQMKMWLASLQVLRDRLRVGCCETCSTERECRGLKIYADGGECKAWTLMEL